MAAYIGGVVHLFRNHDLRLADNPALHAAQQDAQRNGCPLYLLYCAEETSASRGSALALWQRQHRNTLAEHIVQLGGILGYCPHSELLPLLQQNTVHAVHWNRRYTPHGIAADTQLKSALHAQGIRVHSHRGNVLFEPFDPATLNQQGNPYQVFTPFAHNLLAKLDRIKAPLNAPHSLHCAAQCLTQPVKRIDADHAWENKILRHWQIGEDTALQHAQSWITQAHPYQTNRDIPSIANGTSKLSPYLNIGAISPRHILHLIRAHDPNFTAQPDMRTFVKELLWREFAYSILYHYPDTRDKPFQSKFNAFPWHDLSTHQRHLHKWQRGLTGIPIVDAGMRELWATGWMHNRVRMLVASYLTKNLRLHWHYGAAWFMHTLLDADPASNTMGWQWVAGCGVDAAPYFRIFNPLLQAQKFDPQAAYIKRWLPELKKLDAVQCRTPWQYTAYPQPDLDLKESRQAALAAFKAL